MSTNYLFTRFPFQIFKAGARGRGAKSGGTGEPGSQKVNWPAESLWGEVKILCSICKYYVSADNDVNING